MATAAAEPCTTSWSFAKEADGSLTMVGRTPEIAAGQTARLELALAAGEYELECSIVEEVDGQTISHYAEGMCAAFHVS